MNQGQLERAALWALYGLAAHTLVRITVEYDGSALSVQIVMLDSASEDEIESLRCFVTELIAHFFDAKLNEEFISVAAASDARKIKDLPIKVFAIDGAQYFSEET